MESPTLLTGFYRSQPCQMFANSGSGTFLTIPRIVNCSIQVLQNIHRISYSEAVMKTLKETLVRLIRMIHRNLKIVAILEDELVHSESFSRIVEYFNGVVKGTSRPTL